MTIISLYRFAGDEKIAFEDALHGLRPAAYVELPPEAGTIELHQAILQAASEWVLILDAQTNISGELGEPNVGIDTFAFGVLAQTYTGLSAGYRLCSTRAQIDFRLRLPIACIPKNMVQGNYLIDFPNVGAIGIRKDAYLSLNGFDCSKAVESAIDDLMIRIIEHGKTIACNRKLINRRAAGYIDMMLSEERTFQSLRSMEQWQSLVDDRALQKACYAADLHVIGNMASAQELVERAGYPIDRVIACDDDTAAELLQAHKLERPKNIFAIVDNRSIDLPENWLRDIVLELVQRDDIGAATLGSSDCVGVVAGVDAFASALRLDRIPMALLQLHATKLAPAVEELTKNAARIGIGSRATAHGRPAAYELARVITDPAQIILEQRPPSPVEVVMAATSTAENIFQLSGGELRKNTLEADETSFAIHREMKNTIRAAKFDHGKRVHIENSSLFYGSAISRSFLESENRDVVIITDNIVITEGWLPMLQSVLQRLPNVGIVSCRMMNGKGHQNATDVRYLNLVELSFFAKARKIERAREVSLVTSLYVPMLLIRREVIDAVGAFDKQLGISEYGVLDYAVRAQLAGYSLAIAEDLLVHRIDPNIAEIGKDETAALARLYRDFCKKWGLPVVDKQELSIEAMMKFSGAKENIFIPLPARQEAYSQEVQNVDRHVFLLTVEGEQSWQRAGNLVRKYLKAFKKSDPVTLALGRAGDMAISVIVERLHNIMSSLEMHDDEVPDILVSDAENREEWLKQLPSGSHTLLTTDSRLTSLPVISDSSPSGLRRDAFETVKECA